MFGLCQVFLYSINTKVSGKRISKIEIEFITSETTNDNSYELYSVTPGGGTTSTYTEGTDKVTYNLVTTKEVPRVDENNAPVLDENGNQIYDTVEVLVGNGSAAGNEKDTNYTLTTFTSSVLMDHDVIVNWHDTGIGRPEGDSQTGNLGIELERKIDTDSSFTVCSGYTPTITHPTSNIDTYEYKVPKYDQNNNPYTYGAECGDNFSYNNSTTNLPYRSEHTSDTNIFDMYSTRTFDFTLNWLCSNDAKPNTEEAIKNYITANFDLYDETELVNGTHKKILNP